LRPRLAPGLPFFSLIYARHRAGGPPRLRIGGELDVFPGQQPALLAE
jgi:hypothetical protein